jgi:hypothetical protein
MVKPRNTRNTRTGRQSLRLFVCVLYFTICLSALAVPANRWLLIVETSRATQSRREATAQLAGNLILSGMNGQMRAGDTVGVWTFNSALHSGEFPLQKWTSKNAKGIAERTALFLAMRKFEGRPNLGGVLPAMEKLITNSEFITVVLISSGSETIRGTPYDEAINTLQKRFQVAQDKAGMPFVTVLRAQGGRIVEFKVNTPPLTLEFPPLPPELQITNAVVENPGAEVKPVEAPPPQPALVVPPLIVHGKKPEPEVKSNPAVEIAPVVTPEPVLLPRTTNAVAAVTNAGTAQTQAVAPQIAITTNQNTPAAPIESSRATKLWVAGVLAGCALVALVFVLRRPRKGSHTSLITRSLDRDQK